MSFQVKMSLHHTEPVINLGGQTVNMVPLARFPSYKLYGGDISSLAGEVATLSITEPPPPHGITPPSWVLLDDIVSSPQMVPEPGVLALFTLGASLIAGCF